MFVESPHDLGSANYIYTDTKAFTENMLCTKETVTIDGVTSVTNFIYDNLYHLMPTRQVTTCSQTNSTIETQIKYPSDINAGVYASMANLNMLSYPILQTRLKDGNITGSTLTTYKANGSTFVPDSVLSLETTTPLSSITSFTGSTASIDNRYGKAKIKYNSYDINGNVTQYTTSDGLVTTLFWGYNKTYPVAKIVSGNTLTIDGSLRNTINNRSYCGTDIKTQVDADINFLSQELSTFIANNNYQVTLYTYKPLVGLTSETIANSNNSSGALGVTSYYSYDSFGRLSEVRDDEGKLLKKHTYNYANQ
jgi:YD repeat-containing protein